MHCRCFLVRDVISYVFPNIYHFRSCCAPPPPEQKEHQKVVTHNSLVAWPPFLNMLSWQAAKL